MRSHLQPSVLLVGDESLHKGGVKDFLARRGITASLVKKLPEAEQKLKDSSFDIIITNLKLPEIGGVDFLKWLKGVSPSQVVMVVGDGLAPSQLEELLTHGASDLLEEPFDGSELESRIKKVWSSKDSNRQWRVANYLVEGHCRFEFFSREVNPVKFANEVVESPLVSPHIERPVRLRIILALQEAITNAWEHGNLELLSEWKEEFLPDGKDRYSLEKDKRLADPLYGERLLSFEVSLSGKRLSFVVKDTGKGFLEKAKVFDSSDSLLPYGRGLAIMRAVMDEVTFHDAGREVRMVKVLE